MKDSMIRFSDDDEEFLDRIITPPVTPPISDDEADEKDKSLWYDDKSFPDPSISVNLTHPHGKHCFLAGETVEVDVTCTVRQLQLLSGFLEGFCVADGKCEQMFCFQEVLLYPHQQYQENPYPLSDACEGKGKADRSSHYSHPNHNVCERRFKFWLTIPLTVPPSLRVNSKTGIFYRIRVGGIGEVQQYHILPHHHSLPHHSILQSSIARIGGVDNYSAIKVRNNTCAYVSKTMLSEKPQTSFSVTAPVAGSDITLKVHLVGTAPYSVIGQLCTFFVKIDNATEKHTKGLTVKLIQHIHTTSTSRAFLKGSHDDDELLDKCNTLAKYKFHSEEYCCSPRDKLQTQLAVLVPHTFTPTIATQNLHATYGLFVRVDVSSTHGLAQEMPILVLPCQLDAAVRKAYGM